MPPLRVLNPVSPVTATDKTDVQTALDALAVGGNRAPTFDEIRAQLASGKRARFTDGMLCQTIQDMGGALKVIES